MFFSKLALPSVVSKDTTTAVIAGGKTSLSSATPAATAAASAGSGSVSGSGTADSFGGTAAGFGGGSGRRGTARSARRGAVRSATSIATGQLVDSGAGRAAASDGSTSAVGFSAVGAPAVGFSAGADSSTIFHLPGGGPGSPTAEASFDPGSPPEETEADAAKRRAIRALSGDASLPDAERRRRVQTLMDGTAEATAEAQSAPGGSAGTEGLLAGAAAKALEADK